MRHGAARVLVVGVAALALGACSGGSDSSPIARDVPRNASTTTTAAPAQIDLSQPIPGGSLHGTPRSPLQNTGDDYVAILESLVANFRWLTENPDVSSLDALYVPGTEAHQFQVDFFQELLSNGWRSGDDGYQLVSAEVVDARPEAVSMRFADSFAVERIVDSNGAQVGSGRTRDPATKTWNVLLTVGADGRWRLADVALAHPGAVAL